MLEPNYTTRDSNFKSALLQELAAVFDSVIPSQYAVVMQIELNREQAQQLLYDITYIKAICDVCGIIRDGMVVLTLWPGYDSRQAVMLLTLNYGRVVISGFNQVELKAGDICLTGQRLWQWLNKSNKSLPRA